MVKNRRGCGGSKNRVSKKAKLRKASGFILLLDLICMGMPTKLVASGYV
jgi:hypothetical protein